MIMWQIMRNKNENEKGKKHNEVDTVSFDKHNMSTIIENVHVQHWIFVMNRSNEFTCVVGDIHCWFTSSYITMTHRLIFSFPHVIILHISIAIKCNESVENKKKKKTEWKKKQTHQVLIRIFNSYVKICSSRSLFDRRTRIVQYTINTFEYNVWQFKCKSTYNTNLVVSNLRSNNISSINLDVSMLIIVLHVLELHKTIADTIIQHESIHRRV
jgi:hypothetical protein